MTQPPKPDLDLIQMVQRARMLHDADAQPSQVTAVYWIEAKPEAKPTVTTPPPTTRAGEWVIETDVTQVDALWAAVKAATLAGTLGYKAKVSTSSRTDDTAHRIVIVRTPDADDTADVERVRAALVALGITSALRYVRVNEEPVA
ncbi:MAG: DUF1917 domain-containing protein [Armatimonadetes bacterium]|nr:DUF1917 domain-containing protein [Anaerolineae bacterium]